MKILVIFSRNYVGTPRFFFEKIIIIYAFLLSLTKKLINFFTRLLKHLCTVFLCLRLEIHKKNTQMATYFKIEVSFVFVAKTQSRTKGVRCLRKTKTLFLRQVNEKALHLHPGSREPRRYFWHLIKINFDLAQMNESTQMKSKFTCLLVYYSFQGNVNFTTNLIFVNFFYHKT